MCDRGTGTMSRPVEGTGVLRFGKIPVVAIDGMEDYVEKAAQAL